MTSSSKKTSAKSLPELTPAEREVMDVVWDRGEVTATQLRDVLDRGLSRNTVRTLLERIEGKGWIAHSAEGRTFIYSPVRPREATIGQKVRDVVDTVCGGKPETLVAALLDYRGLKKGELDRIRRMLDEAKAGTKTGR